jgi:hypothetical protein
MGEMLNTHLNVTEIPESKRPFGGYSLENRF